MAALVIAIQSPTPDPTYATAHRLLDISGDGNGALRLDLVSWVNSAGGSGTGTYTNTGAPGAWTYSFEITGIVLSSGDNVITVTARDLSTATANAELTATYTIPASRVGSVPKYKLRSKLEKKFL